MGVSINFEAPSFIESTFKRRILVPLKTTAMKGPGLNLSDSRMKLVKMFFSLLFCLNVGQLCFSQTSNDIFTFLKKCSSAYQSRNFKQERRVEISKSQLQNDLASKLFHNNGLQKAHAVIYVFNLKKDKKYYLRLKVMVYEYNTLQNAASKFHELKKSNTKDVDFSKDWDYILLIGNNIVRLDTTCIYSELEWEKEKSFFSEIVKSAFGQFAINEIQCNCGGDCDLEIRK